MFTVTGVDQQSTPVNLQATGREPLILTVSNVDAQISYDSGGTSVTLAQGTYLYEVQHPFAGQFRLQNTATLTFMIGGAI